MTNDSWISEQIGRTMSSDFEAEKMYNIDKDSQMRILEKKFFGIDFSVYTLICCSVAMHSACHQNHKMEELIFVTTW
jgi:hypothetical protein